MRADGRGREREAAARSIHVVSIPHGLPRPADCGGGSRMAGAPSRSLCRTGSAARQRRTTSKPPWASQLFASARLSDVRMESIRGALLNTERGASD